jgi:hypothetical protein
MQKIIWIIAASLYLSPVSALLPPLYHTLNEFKALIEDPQLPGKLDSSHVIESIVRSDKGFEVTTNKAVLQVDVVTEPPQKGWVGPARFHLVFHDPIPLTR